MSSILRLDHQTTYRYASLVNASYNEARMTPASTQAQVTLAQMTLEASLQVEPATDLYTYWDYFGTLVHCFDLQAPHDELTVHSSAVVETGLVQGTFPPAPSWDDLMSPALLDRHCEYLLPSPLTQPDETLAGLADEIRTSSPDPKAALSKVLEVIDERMAYQKGVTDTTTTASTALHLGRGVCQDYAHVAIALLRLTGIPARYASGYFHHHRNAGIGEVVIGESHAWIEAWLGDWIGMDPTNAVPVGSWHVLVGRGRDYRDVAPLRGIYSGGPSVAATTEVKIVLLGEGGS